MVNLDSDPNKVIVNIGCNKGEDMVRWVRNWSPSRMSVQAWTEYMQDEHKVPRKLWACGLSSRKEGLQVNMQEGAGTERAEPQAVCVEPMPRNVKLLQAAKRHFQYRLHIVAAAVGEEGNRTAMFPDGAAGTAGNRIAPQGSGAGYVRVPMKTVDEIVAELQLPRVDVLLIDAEGWDPAVLRGAAKALESVRYLEFEVHRDFSDTPWGRTTLRSVVTDLSSASLDCFWSGNDGSLRSLNRCWQPDWEKAGWSNVVCLRAGDPWSQIVPAHTRPISCE